MHFKHNEALISRSVSYFLYEDRASGSNDNSFVDHRLLAVGLLSVGLLSVGLLSHRLLVARLH